MDARLEEPVHGSKEKKKRHIQRVRSPLRYTHRFRPRFEGKHLHSRFRFFRTMEERRFIRRPNFALRYQRHHTYQRPRACPRPGSTHTEDRTDISRPSPGNRSSLSSTVYRQDCDIFGMVVKMLVAKDPSLEKPIQLSLRENLRDIGMRCIKAMEQFIHEYDSRELEAPSGSLK
ncbi:uncharacterized protein LOC122340943 isoform X4 [Puntigrus tetrazona]|uniref:uncharacterized protein LOC122340943 isoform X4 n=1 Tax=Puntigrus tetrazona TaxID=1606681 RepID=UPI001C8A0DE7|nr:uncharacterized protein LOC122340943 isoform X4 [Puntigrus tetrazona]